MGLAPGVAVGLAVVASLACGPSFQAVYEGDVRFEHCYALDQSPAHVDAQEGVLAGWLHDYTYGQSRDRVEYARPALQRAVARPTLPSEDTQVKHARIMASPVPTSAFAPPPSLAEHVTAESSASAATSKPPPREAAVAAARAPGEECSEGCSGYWKTCKAGCKGATCEACDRAYKLCVPGCFKK